MARCKCQICKAELDSKTAFKVTDKNGKNKYYCSETEYDAEEQCKKKVAEDKDKVYRLICDIMGEPEIINTILFKEWVIWNKVADNEKIGKYLDENKEYLTSVIARLQSSEFARIRYLSAIIKDRIKGFVPKVEITEVPRVVNTSFELFEPTLEKNPQVEEQILYDVEDDLL